MAQLLEISSTIDQLYKSALHQVSLMTDRCSNSSAIESFRVAQACLYPVSITTGWLYNTSAIQHISFTKDQFYNASVQQQVEYTMSSLPKVNSITGKLATCV